MNPILKLVVETGPLIAFFASYSLYDLMVATAVFMVAVAISLSVSVVLERRVPIMPLVTAAVVMVFGGLTLWLDDDTFIKMKPTIINGLFVSILLGGLALGRAFLKPLFGTVFQIDESGWRKLSLRWALFFVAVAILNEAVWRSTSTDMWVNFKVFGIMPLTILFSFSQVPLLTRYRVPEEASSPAE